MRATSVFDDEHARGAENSGDDHVPPVDLGFFPSRGPSLEFQHQGGDRFLERLAALGGPALLAVQAVPAHDPEASQRPIVHSSNPLDRVTDLAGDSVVLRVWRLPGSVINVVAGVVLLTANGVPLVHGHDGSSGRSRSSREDRFLGWSIASDLIN